MKRHYQWKQSTIRCTSSILYRTAELQNEPKCGESIVMINFDSSGKKGRLFFTVETACMETLNCTETFIFLIYALSIRKSYLSLSIFVASIIIDELVPIGQKKPLAQFCVNKLQKGVILMKGKGYHLKQHCLDR